MKYKLIDDPHYGNDFGEREIGINDEYGRLDLEIFAECAQSDFPLDKYPECEYPDTMYLYTMEEAHKMAKEIFEDNIKYTHPYVVGFWGNKRKILDYARENTTCGVRINAWEIRFDDRHDHAAVYLKFKPFEVPYTPKTYYIKFNEEDVFHFNEDSSDDDNIYMDEIIRWLKENVGEEWLCWEKKIDGFSFFDDAHRMAFKLMWM